MILSGCLIYKEKSILLLYRKDHDHYETPGGKLEKTECLDMDNPTIEELSKTALREVHEELGNRIELSELKYFGNVEFIAPNGKKAVANKFLAKIISGVPTIAEPDKFSRLEYISIEELEKKNISQDLRLLMPELRKYFDVF
ncbi:MAG: NUDIX domain-containing protein [Candidatus Woesearchaeota archaeon]